MLLKGPSLYGRRMSNVRVLARCPTTACPTAAWLRVVRHGIHSRDCEVPTHKRFASALCGD
jgi:hypothetical protein